MKSWEVNGKSKVRGMFLEYAALWGIKILPTRICETLTAAVVSGEVN